MDKTKNCKTCKTCGKTKNITNFYKLKNGYIYNHCIPCKKEKARITAKKHYYSKGRTDKLKAYYKSKNYTTLKIPNELYERFINTTFYKEHLQSNNLVLV